MKKLLSLILVFILTFVAFSDIATIFADTIDNSQEQEFKYEDYVEGLEEGWIGDDVSFEEIQKLNNDAKALVEDLESDPNFYEVNTRSTTTFRAGDIIVTNGVKYPIAGHAGIFIGKNTILHIAGEGYTPSTLTYTTWKGKYNTKSGTWTKVYRNVNSNVGPQASTWAINTYYKSNAKYKITTNRRTTSETYCSKIVWQAYYYGAGSTQVKGNKYTLDLIAPYGLKNNIYNSQLLVSYTK